MNPGWHWTVRRMVYILPPYHRRSRKTSGEQWNALFEIGYDQGQAVSELMRTEGYREVQVVQDYAGLDRVVFGTYVTVQPAPFAKSR